MAGDRSPVYVMTATIPSEGVERFRRFEDLVLPLLAEFGGELAQRLRSDDGRTEVHVVRFPDEGAFERYRGDPRRTAAVPLLEDSGARTSLVRLNAVGDPRPGAGAPPAERNDDGYELSTDPGRLEIGTIHGFLHDAYWSRGIARAAVERSIGHSLPFGLYAPDGAQCGFARVVSDRTTFALLADVFVLPGHRGRGLAAWMVGRVLADPELQGLRRWLLATADAHGLYRRFGFSAPRRPDQLLVIEAAPRP